MPQDEYHLKLLSIFHYVLGGITALAPCLCVFHLAVGIAMLPGSFGGGDNTPPRLFGLLFIVLPALFMLMTRPELLYRRKVNVCHKDGEQSLDPHLPGVLEIQLGEKLGEHLYRPALLIRAIGRLPTPAQHLPHEPVDLLLDGPLLRYRTHLNGWGKTNDQRRVLAVGEKGVEQS